MHHGSCPGHKAQALTARAARVDIGPCLVDLAPQIAPLVGREATAAPPRITTLRLLLLLAALILGALLVLALLILTLSAFSAIRFALILLRLLILLGLLVLLILLRLAFTVARSGMRYRHCRYADQTACGEATNDRLHALLVAWYCMAFDVRVIHGVPLPRCLINR
jgi:hypothetical protein